MTAPSRHHSVFLRRLPLPEQAFVAEALRTETVDGVLLGTALAALILANSPLNELCTSSTRPSGMSPAGRSRCT